MLDVSKGENKHPRARSSVLLGESFQSANPFSFVVDIQSLPFASVVVFEFLLMADFGISVASQLAATAVTVAVQKISKVVSFGDDVQRLQQKLIELQALFMDADRGFWKHESRSIKLWIRELQYAALDAEDAVEIYAALRFSGSSTIHSSSNFSFRAFKSLFANYFRKARSYSELSSLCSQIGRINQTLNSLESRAGVLLPGIVIKNFKVSDSFHDMNLWKKSEIILEESTSVDVDYKVDQIVSLIEEHKVVAVVGMGGSGKTRLLQHVYKSLSANNKYEEFIWLCVSQIYSIKQLQLDVLSRLNRLGNTDQSCSVTVLHSKIYSEMREKDCLVVLDDVWDLPETEQGKGANLAQKLLSIGFPTDGNRCSVLISTRDYKVAQQFGSYVYPMPLLPDDKSYDLLCKRLLPHSEFGEMVFTKFQDESIKMLVKKCGGLPLAIVAVAGIMKHQHPDEWPSTLEKMERSSSAPESSSSSAAAGAPVSDLPQSAVITALQLSFNALEFRVKPCFAFLGVFAEDEEIESEKLIGMWLAEGLVESEEDGLSMLKHLSNRCLLNMKHQDEEGSRRSRMYSITVHDLIHDLAMSIYKESGGICQGSSSKEAFARELQSERRVLRMDIGNSKLNRIPNSFRCPRSVRLLRFSFGYSSNLRHIPEETLANARALRTWDLRAVQVTSLPKCVSQLRILKFLDISGTGIGSLPRCLRELKHLQYLYTWIRVEVPSWVGELQRLTHFSSDDGHCRWELQSRTHFCSDDYCEWKKVNEIMPSLKVVRGMIIEIGSGGGARKKTWTWDAVARLTQLQEVGLVVHDIESGVFPPHTLESLSMKLKEGSAAVTIPHEWAQHLHKLEDLCLGEGVEFPRQALGFSKLTRLSLMGHSEEYSPEIGKLPQLRFLTLAFNEKCKMLPHEFGAAGAFPNLITLYFFRLGELCMLPAIEDGAMPCLADMHVVDCRRLREVGHGWEDKIRTLAEFSVRGNDPTLDRHLLEVRRS